MRKPKPFTCKGILVANISNPGLNAFSPARIVIHWIPSIGFDPYDSDRFAKWMAKASEYINAKELGK